MSEREHKIIVVFVALVILLGGVYGASHLLGMRSFHPLIYGPRNGHIIARGTVVCLPHRNAGEVETTECALGLQDADGNYFSLEDSIPPTMENISVNEVVEVEGTFTAENTSIYQSIGVIKVIRITPSASTGVVSSTTSGASGIRGLVLLGPVCPVLKDPPEIQCADRPYATKLVVMPKNQTQVIKEFSSNASGTFRVDLPRGEYTIRAAAGTNILPRCESEVIPVSQEGYTQALVYCDTGIR
jgi:hypothetical protein